MVGRIKVKFYAEVLKKIKSVPNGLCYLFCPQYWNGWCTALRPAVSDEQERRKSRTYRKMSYLCLQDPFWWRYYMPENFSMSTVHRFWGVKSD